MCNSTNNNYEKRLEIILTIDLFCNEGARLTTFLLQFKHHFENSEAFSRE